MYALLLVTCGQVGCNGGGFQNYSPQFYYPPAVFQQPQFPQFQSYGNYSYSSFSGGYSYPGPQFQSYPQFGPTWSSSAWSPAGSGSYGFQRRGQIQLFGRPLIGFQGYRQFGNSAGPGRY